MAQNHMMNARMHDHLEMGAPSMDYFRKWIELRNLKIVQTKQKLRNLPITRKHTHIHTKTHTCIQAYDFAKFTNKTPHKLLSLLSLILEIKNEKGFFKCPTVASNFSLVRTSDRYEDRLVSVSPCNALFDCPWSMQCGLRDYQWCKDSGRCVL